MNSLFNSVVSSGLAIILGVETSILPEDLTMGGLLRLILNILVYGLGIAAVIGVVVAGIMYMTARDNEQQVAKAKTRLTWVVGGLVAWAVMFGVANWLIPGGLDLDADFDPPSTEVSGGHQTGNNGNSSNNSSNNNPNQNQGDDGDKEDGSTSDSHTKNGVTTIVHDGVTYAYPIQNATKTNVLAIKDASGTAQPPNWQHGASSTGYMMDLMLYDKPYKEGTASSPAWQDPVYVVAMTSGRISWRAPGKGPNGVSYPADCATVGIIDDNGVEIDYMHLAADKTTVPQPGAYVSAGDVIGKVGPTKCTAEEGSTNWTAPHLHLQFGTGHAFRKDRKLLPTIMNELWEVLPE